MGTRRTDYGRERNGKASEWLIDACWLLVGLQVFLLYRDQEVSFIVINIIIIIRQIWLDRQAIELVQKRRQQNKNNTKGNQRKHRHFRKTDRKGDRELSEQERRERGLADEEKSLVDEERRERGLADEEKRERGLADELKTDITDEVLQSNK